MNEILDNSEENHNSEDKRSLRDLIDNGYEFDFAYAIERAFAIWQKDIVGFSLYALLSAVIIFFSIFTLVGPLLLGGPLMAGYIVVANKIARGEDHEFGDFFGGFQYFKELLVHYLILIAFFLVPAVILIVGNILSTALISEIFIIFLPFGYLLFFVLAIFVATVYLLAMPFIVIGKMRSWPAMEASRKVVMKNFWWFLLLSIVAGFIAEAGIIAFGIGIFVTMSLQYLIYFAAYEKIVGLDDRSSEEAEVLKKQAEI
ncbi:DUF2189 domain-containing protein [Halocola ammonii]